MQCELLSTCAFIEKAKKFEPFMVNMIKLMYCESNKNDCSRYKLHDYLPEREIPDDLWPS